MIRGFLSDVLAKWKRFRWQGLVKVWAVFMAIALVLLVESLGVHYGVTRFDITYLDRNKAIPAANAIAGEKLRICWWLTVRRRASAMPKPCSTIFCLI